MSIEEGVRFVKGSVTHLLSKPKPKQTVNYLDRKIVRWIDTKIERHKIYRN